MIEDLKLVLKKNDSHQTVVKVGDLNIGQDFVVMAGPCSVESREQILDIAGHVSRAGANMLRGGAFKPRTSPYSFQGLREDGLKCLKEASEKYGLPTITEVIDAADIDLVSNYADILQVGTRNMQNFSLLKALGKTDKPILLKRGMSATIEEWLSSAEYILQAGNPKVILCERGIRTFETYTKNTLDLGAVAAAKSLTHLPVIVDPSHATGHYELIRPMSLAAIMAGADGLEIEVHVDPTHALSDRDQQITPDKFDRLMVDINKTLNLLKQM